MVDDRLNVGRTTDDGPSRSDPVHARPDFGASGYRTLQARTDGGRGHTGANHARPDGGERRYEAVHSRPDGESTVARMALTASEYGYDGIVVRNHGGEPIDADLDAIRDGYDVDVVRGVEIRAEDAATASGYLGQHREERAIVAVHGGDPEINAFAVRQHAVDVLVHPLRDDGTFDSGMAAAAARHGVRVELPLGPLVAERGGSRVRRMRDLRRLQALCASYDVPTVVSVDATSHLHLRAPRDLGALAEAAGLDTDAVSTGLAEWGALVARNRDRLADDFVEPGVRIVDRGADERDDARGDEPGDERGDETAKGGDESATDGDRSADEGDG